MHNLYIINNLIEFNPATSTLVNLDDRSKEVLLNSPASRCLLLLINKVGSIVTQQEFMGIVWNSQGMLVSANTFYQNISILRKGLKKIGLDDIVVTIPRLGLTLIRGTNIKVITAESQTLERKTTFDVINDSSMVEQDCIDPEDFVDLSIFIEKLETIQLDKSTTKIKSIKKILLSKKSILIITILITFTFVFYLALNNFGKNHFFSNYSLMENSLGCHIFVSNSKLDSMIINKTFDKMSHVTNKSCQDYPWVYITKTPFLDRISIIHCNKSMNEKNMCVSDYFFEGE